MVKIIFKLGKNILKMSSRKQKSVLILGSSSDIGIEILKIYLKNNYKIVAHYNLGNKIFSDLVKKNSKQIKKVKFNFSTKITKIESFFKKELILNTDVLINSLGAVMNVKYEKLKIDDIDRILKINSYPAIYATNKIGARMAKKKWGRIVNLGSIGVKFGGNKNNFPYSISKFILEFFPATKDWIKKNVLINTIRVGATQTKLHKNLPNKNLRLRAQLIPMKRMANPTEIAKFVYFIGSEHNTYISHQVIPISGGE